MRCLYTFSEYKTAKMKNHFNRTSKQKYITEYNKGMTGIDRHTDLTHRYHSQQEPLKFTENIKKCNETTCEYKKM